MIRWQALIPFLLPSSSPKTRMGLWTLVCSLIGALLFVCDPVLAATAAKNVSSIVPTLQEPAASLTVSSAAEHTPDLVFGLFIGVMLTASMYLFFIWIVIRDRGQVFLMLLLLCLAINMASTNDSMMETLGIFSLTMRKLLQSYSMILAYIFSIFFTYYFLEVDTNARFMRTPLTILAGFLALLLVYAAFDQRPVPYVLPTLGTLSILVAMITGLVAVRLHVSGSLSHLVAFTFFLLGGLSDPLYELGFITRDDLSRNLTYAAFSLATMMFAIVIAGQFAARQEEKERALEISNERFALAARGSNEGLFDWNRQTNEVYFSEQFRRIIGIPLESNAKGLAEWMKLVQGSDRRIIFAALRKFRENTGSSTINFEYRIVKSSSDVKWIHTKAVATRDPHTGRLIRLVGSVGDITQRKRGEAELRASETRFRSITEAHPVPVLIAKLQDHFILYASPGAESLLGLPHGTLVSHKLDRFLTRLAQRKEIMTAMSSGQEVNMMEVTLTRGDGENLPAALSARRINYQNEAAMVIGLYDLTERKKAEVQIAQQQEALQQSEKMAALGGLLAGVAHELNNPLSVVMGQTTLLTEGQADEKVKSRAEKIFKAADRCSRIVKSFLALARRKPPERKDQDLNAIISNSLELLSYQFRNESVALELKLDPKLPPVLGDGDQLTQVFTNLALNAAQAFHEWTGPHHLTISSSTLEDGSIEILVRDTGPGVPAEIRNRIFEPFFTTKSGTGGTGVGLALCLNIIEGHGGQLKLEETPGGGATFRATFPASTHHPEAAAQSTDTDSAAIVGEQKLRILLVDDEVELAQTLADLLEPMGHDIDLAANGAIALEKIQKKGCDIIISDLRMPVLDGPGLYAALARNLPNYLNRIIYVTGDTLSPHVQTFLSETPVPVIEKPYRLVDVQNALAKLLKENASQSNIGKADSPRLPQT